MCSIVLTEATPAELPVTVIVAAYRSDPTQLQAALASALAQTCRNIEVMVSDDSPDDGLRTWVDAFADARLHYRHNKPALGVARNHWACFGAARGEYIVVLNHDDLLEPNSVETLLHALRAEPTAVLAFADHWVIDGAGQRLLADTERNSQVWGRSTLRAGLHQPFIELVVRQSIPMAMGAMFRRSALVDVCPPSAGPAYDLWLAYLLARGGGAAVYVPERLSAWRTHASNLTSLAGDDWLLGSASCWQAMAEDAALATLAPAVIPAARRQAARWFYVCARQALRAGHRNVARRRARQSLALVPNWRGACAWLFACWPFGRGVA